MVCRGGKTKHQWFGEVSHDTLKLAQEKSSRIKQLHHPSEEADQLQPSNCFPPSYKLIRT